MEEIYHHNSGFNFNTILKVEPHQVMDLISLGTRSKYMLVIYGAGLYTYPKITEISNIFKPIYTKCIHLKFYRSVYYENIYKSFADTIEKRIQLNKISNELNQMYNIFKNIKNIENSDTIDLLWYSDTLEILYNSTFAGKIKSKLFVKAIYNCYLDENSITPDILHYHQDDIVSSLSNLNIR